MWDSVADKLKHLTTMVCGKVIFKTQSEAIFAINGLQSDSRPGRVNRKPQQTYWCIDCEAYHINSKQKKRRNKTRFKNMNTKSDTEHKYKSDQLVIRNFTSKRI